MAWTFTEARNIAVEQDNIDRVQVALVTAALAISDEADTTTNYVNRVNLANQVLQSPGRWAEIMVWGVVTDAAVQDGPNDANIYNAVLANWDAYAGVIPSV